MREPWRTRSGHSRRRASSAAAGGGGSAWGAPSASVGPASLCSDGGDRRERPRDQADTRSVIASYPEAPRENGGVFATSCGTPAPSTIRARIRCEPPAGGVHGNVHRTHVRLLFGGDRSVAADHVIPPSVLPSTRDTPLSPENAMPPIVSGPLPAATVAGAGMD